MVVSANTVLELIGNTPLVKLNKFSNSKVEIWIKLEKYNPSGSIKDRAVKYMILGAEKRRELKKGKTILEPTSGNTGISLAMISAVKGYKAKIVMPENMSIERRKIMEAFGAEIVLTPAKGGMDYAIAYARELFRKNPEKYIMLDQFDNPDNVKAHYETTGEEIWKQTDGNVTHVVAGIGTSGTIMGVSKKLKELNGKIKIIGVQPEIGESIQGLKNINEQIRPSIFKRSLIDEIYEIKQKQAIKMAKELAKKEGIFVGMSSGAAAYIGIKIAKKLKNGSLVIIAPDGGEKYLTTKMFGGN